MFRYALAALVTVLAAFPASAADLRMPSGDVILTVTGDIEVFNAADSAIFDFDMLAELQDSEFTTSTIWTEGPQTFTGVSFGSFVQLLGINSGTISLHAINDYAVEFSASEATQAGPIIAFLRNGERMSVRDKGPLWLVFPYDLDEKFQTKVIYTSSIWQLDRITVEK